MKPRPSAGSDPVGFINPYGNMERAQSERKKAVAGVETRHMRTEKGKIAPGPEGRNKTGTSSVSSSFEENGSG
jgi:hypothetical protein